MPGFVRLWTGTGIYLTLQMCQGLYDYGQGLDIPDAANVRFCPTVYSDWIYRTLQMTGFVRLLTGPGIYRMLQMSRFVRIYTMTEYTGRHKFQVLTNFLQ